MSNVPMVRSRSATAVRPAALGLTTVIRASAVLSALVSCSVLAAPAIQQVSGTLDHKSVITISGSGFGTKTTAAPVVWDDASGNNIGEKWQYWPNNNPTYNTAYRAPMRGIGLPHGNISRYIAGAHAEALGAYGGTIVVFFRTFTAPSYPFYVYASWYQRNDDAWVFGGDNNLKTFAYSNGGSPYEMPNNWYINYGPPNPSSRTGYAQWAINDDGASMQNPDINGHNYWWNQAVNPMSGVWSKVEVATKLTGANDGYIRVYENGKKVVDYLGPTDKYPGTSRTVGIGGYARNYGQPNNWRYFADAYFDLTLSRIVLANNPQLSAATIIENQIPKTWSASSISATVNLGKFTAGQTAYLFVVDSTGAANGTGYAVTIGGTASTPAPPDSVAVQ